MSKKKRKKRHSKKNKSQNPAAAPATASAKAKSKTTAKAKSKTKGAKKPILAERLAEPFDPEVPYKDWAALQDDGIQTALRLPYDKNGVPFAIVLLWLIFLVFGGFYLMYWGMPDYQFFFR